MIETFFDITATNVRKTTASPTGGDSSVTIGSFAGLVVPVTERAKLFIENNMGNEFDLVADNAVDINIGDNVYIGSDKYDTLGIAVFADLEDASDSYVNIRVVKK